MEDNLRQDMSPDWDYLRSRFPVTENFIYFNHAAIAPLSLTVKEQIDECNRKFCDQGIVVNREYLEHVEHTRKLAADLIKVSPSEISFVKNTTQGIQIAANGIRWEKGDNVIIPGNEFPANVFPWLNLAGRGVETRFAPVNNGRFTVEDIAQCIDKRTRAVSVSAVSFTNGFRCDLDEIGRLCNEKGVLFIVDAIQALGAVNLDLGNSNIDLLSADAHKWLLGPQGIGFAYISEAMLDKLDIMNMGYRSMINESDYLNYDIRLKPDASRFEEGTMNIMGITGLKASLEMLLSIGIPVIETRIKMLLEPVIKNLTSRGFTIKSPLNKGEESGILSFCHRSMSTDTIYQSLLRSGIVCAQRDGAVRISPHFYNNMDDIGGFLKALP